MNTDTTGTPPPAAIADPNKWPRQIKYIVGNEACERFSYYGMKSILALYITGSLLQSKDKATTIIHLFGFAVYFLPLLGAWISDRFWGRYNTILYISLFYCLGHGVLAFSDQFSSVDGKLICLYTGLSLIAFGAGGIKPCVSAFVGDQFRPDQSHLLQKAYGAFYFSVNFGSFFAFLVIPWIARSHGYAWAFGVPGMLMGLATLIFWLGTKHYVRKPTANQTRTAGFLSVYLEALKNFDRKRGSLTASVVVNFLSSIGMPIVAIPMMVYVALHPKELHAGQLTIGLIGTWYGLLILATLMKWTDLPESFWGAARKRFAAHEVDAARSVSPILAIFTWIPIFWVLFEQSTSTWVLQGAQMVPWKAIDIWGISWTIGAEEMQSMNPLLVMVLVPILTLGVYPLFQKTGIRVTELRRMSVGMILAAASYLIVAAIQTQIDGGVKISVMWQTIPYVVITTAEVLVSVTGLEFAFNQSAPSMKSAIMSFWLLTNGIGQLMIAVVTAIGGGGEEGNASVSPGRFTFYSMLTFVIAAIFIGVAILYKDRTYAAQEKTAAET